METFSDKDKIPNIPNWWAMLQVMKHLDANGPCNKNRLLNVLTYAPSHRGPRPIAAFLSPFNIMFRSFNQKGKNYNDPKYDGLKNRSMVAHGLIEVVEKRSGEFVWGLTQKGKEILHGKYEVPTAKRQIKLNHFEPGDILGIPTLKSTAYDFRDIVPVITDFDTIKFDGVW